MKNIILDNEKLINVTGGAGPVPENEDANVIDLRWHWGDDWSADPYFG